MLNLIKWSWTQWICAIIISTLQMSLFTVVEFPEDNSVEVVPTKWIDFENNTCLYKDGPAGARLRRNSESIPQPEWPTYRVKVKAHYGEKTRKKIWTKLSYNKSLNLLNAFNLQMTSWKLHTHAISCSILPSLIHRIHQTRRLTWEEEWGLDNPK